MPRYNVEYNGKWACFSSVVDDFITGFMNKSDYEEWRIGEYGRSGCIPLEKANQMTIQDAALSLCLNKDRQYVLERAQEVGIPDDIILPLLKQYERERQECDM